MGYGREGEGELGVEFFAEKPEKEQVEGEGCEGEKDDEGLGESCKGERDGDGEDQESGEEVGPPGGQETARVVDGDGDRLAFGILLPVGRGDVKGFGLRLGKSTFGVSLAGGAG